VNPLVAVGLGALILDERPGVATLAGAALIVAAVAVTARYEGRPAAKRELPRPRTVGIRGRPAARPEPGSECPERAA
jgi:hypothetical protein